MPMKKSTLQCLWRISSREPWSLQLLISNAHQEHTQEGPAPPPKDDSVGGKEDETVTQHYHIDREEWAKASAISNSGAYPD
jgi:hypothetical protein